MKDSRRNKKGGKEKCSLISHYIINKILIDINIFIKYKALIFLYNIRQFILFRFFLYFIRFIYLYKKSINITRQLMPIYVIHIFLKNRNREKFYRLIFFRFFSDIKIAVILPNK